MTSNYCNVKVKFLRLYADNRRNNSQLPRKILNAYVETLTHCSSGPAASRGNNKNGENPKSITRLPRSSKFRIPSRPPSYNTNDIVF